MLADNRIPYSLLSYLVDWLFWSMGLAHEVTRFHFRGLQLLGASHDRHGLQIMRASHDRHGLQLVGASHDRHGLQLVGASHDRHGLPIKISDQSSTLII
jgi:hypothetical protein